MTIDEIKRQMFIDSEEVCGNIMIDTYSAQEYVEQAYSKAIDDFVKALRIEYSPVSDEMQNEYDNVCLRFEKIAEQLKAGDAK